MSEAARHCFEAVRAGDKDRFLAALYVPDDRRDHLLALYAFDLEIARIADLVSEPQIGLIRRQWWLDSLDGIYGGAVPAHPVAEALARAVDAARLPKEPLRRLIVARDCELYDDALPDIAELEGYLGETSAVVIQLAALVLAGPEARAAATAAGLAGVALGLTRMLCGRPRRGRHLLPPGLAPAAAVAHARHRLAEARALAGAIPRPALPAFLPAGLGDLYLARLDGAGGNLPSLPVDVSQFRRQLRLWWLARRNRF